VGYFISGELNDYGYVHFPSGDFYIGSFVNNKMHGIGVYYTSVFRYEGST